MAFTPLWIFGYGSLVWRPDFAALGSRPARVRGWARRFWQGSTDHRGTPGAPGRVVTLVPEPQGWCAGRAYQVGPSKAEEVLAQLDVREQGGYERRWVDACDLGTNQPFASALIYLATPENPEWLGPDSPERMASQIVKAKGPSGANLDYLLRLQTALEELGERDEHVDLLARHAQPGELRQT